MAFEEQQARIASGLTIAEYESLAGSPQWAKRYGKTTSKCHVIMLYRQQNQLKYVADDVQAREMERQSKRRPSGRRY